MLRNYQEILQSGKIKRSISGENGWQWEENVCVCVCVAWPQDSEDWSVGGGRRGGAGDWGRKPIGWGEGGNEGWCFIHGQLAVTPIIIGRLYTFCAALYHIYVYMQSVWAWLHISLLAYIFWQKLLDIILMRKFWNSLYLHSTENTDYTIKI